MTHKKRYTLLAGRTIQKDGRSFAYIGNNGGNPVELDDFARTVVEVMNASLAGSEADRSLKNNFSASTSKKIIGSPKNTLWEDE